MANEFIVRKGLIVEGASGGTVVDVQGSQGQLFSVTDDLSGSIFAVSDISGVPILDVNSSGVSYFDGSLGIGTDSPNSKLHVLDGVAGTYTPYGESDTLVIESATPGGISLIGTGTGSASKQSIVFGTTSDVTSATIIYDSNNSFLSIGTTTASNYVRFVSGNGITALTLDASQNATFAGDVTLSAAGTTGEIIRTTDNTEPYFALQRNSGSNGVGVLRLLDGGDLTFDTGATGVGQTTRLTIDGATGNSTFAEQAFSAATSSGDASSTLTTKGYVDSLITGATIYRGAWDPSGGGYGSPDLSGVTQTSGYYYICSADGTAEPNGTGTEPDTWAVGDWVIYNDVSGTGQWQKIDNSSVLSGVGTGQTVALWQGASSVTDSETLGNAPITVSGNNATFAGNITTSGTNATVFADRFSGLGVGAVIGPNGAGTVFLRPSGVGDTGSQSSFTTTLATIGTDATFAGTGTFTGGGNTLLLKKGTGTPAIAFAGTATDPEASGLIEGIAGGGLKFYTSNGGTIGTPAWSSKLTIAAGGNATFAGTVTSPTFLGDLNGTINTATTGTTQTAGDNSTKIATTAYADAAAAAVPIGNYLPLTAGSGSPLTGTLYGTSTNFSGNGDYAGSMTLGTGASTAEANLQIGQGRTGNGYSYIDLIGDATYTDYGLRIIRNNAGANTVSAIIHRGTGNLEISSVEASSTLFKTNNTTALTLTNTQNAIFTGNVGIGTTSPDQKLEVVGNIYAQDRIINADVSLANENLLDQTTIKISNLNDIYANATKTVISEYEARYVNDNTGSTTIRGNAVPGLVDGQVYTVSIYYKDLIGSIYLDIGDTSIDGPYKSATGTSSIPTSGRIYGKAVRTNNAYEFIDINLSTGGSVTLLNPKLEEGSVVTEFIATSEEESIPQTITTNNLISTGKVGIGTTNPLTKLHVAGATGANIIRIENTSTALSQGDTIGAIQFFNNDTTDNSPNIAASIYATAGASGGSGSLRFKTTEPGTEGDPATDTMIITNGGNVGIGTTSPVSHSPTRKTLVVADTVNGANVEIWGNSAGGKSILQSFAGNTYVGNLANGTGAGTTYITSGAGSTFTTILANGNVGIGNTIPQAKMHIGASLNTMPSNTSIAMNGGTTLRFTGGGDGNSDYGSYIAGVTVGSIRTLQLGSRNLSTDELAMTLSQGKVGIGTNTPNAKLDVQGTQGQLFSVTDDLSGDIFSVADISGVPIMNVNSDVTSYFDGNVGIGTTDPETPLHVVGNVKFEGSRDIDFNTADGNIKITPNAGGWSTGYYFSGSSGTFRGGFGAYGTTDALGYYWIGDAWNDATMVIKPDAGNVGIGTVGPGAKLHVDNPNTAANQLALRIDQRDPSAAIANFYQAGTETHSFTTTGTNSGVFTMKSGGNNVVSIRTSGTSYLNGGNVGIGTTLPGAKLHVKESVASSSQIRMSAASNEANYGYLTMTDNTINTAKLTIGTTYGYNTPIDAITIFNGNVGIGTDSPENKLVVQTPFTTLSSNAYMRLTVGMKPLEEPMLAAVQV